MRKKITAIILALSMCVAGMPATYAANDIDLNISINQETIENAFDSFVETAKKIDQAVLEKFTDIVGHWAKQFIDRLVERGVTSGYGDGTIRPDNLISIAEFTTLLVKQQEYDLSGSSNDQWFSTYMETAKDQGIIDDGDFENGVDYNRKIRRDEMARMISRAAGLTQVSGNSFADNDELGSEFEGYIYAVYNAGIISGMPDGTFAPDENATRAHAFTMLDKMYTYLAENQEDPAEENPYMTVYGEIRKPSSMTPNEDIWSDEEFIELIKAKDDKIWNVSRLRTSDDEITELKPYVYPHITNTFYRAYLDLDKEQFFVSILTNNEYEYINIDAITDGHFFDVVKATMYHSQGHDFKMFFRLLPGGVAVCITNELGPKEFSDVGCIEMLVPYNITERESVYVEIDGYEDGKYPVLTEWQLRHLMDESIYEEYGTTWIEASSELREQISDENLFTQRKYTDFIYNVCDYLYEDPEEIYLSLYKAIIDEVYYYENNGKYHNDTKRFETNNYYIFMTSGESTSRVYGISDK